MNKAYIYIISAILLVSIAMPLSAGAYYYPYNAHLYIPGIDGAEQYNQPYSNSGYQTKPVTLNFDIFGSSSSNPSAQNQSKTSRSSGSIFDNLFGSAGSAVAQDVNGSPIVLVTADNTNVYAIISGKKHLIPNVPDVLSEYNYSQDLVQTVAYAQLNKYPRANLVTVKGDSKHIYYLTEGGLLRLMPSDKVIDSYGGRKEDAITIGRVEFNFYPKNQYIYLENPLNRDVFQIVGDGKRYLTPMAAQRMNVTPDQVAPVNQFEMDSYKILAPVVQ
ncbi:MAG: hypothetical protein A2941_02665 [Candidatus Yanofskybacteria bacterium RIFCSPLOWO2_01_FULL_49_17]|uniref:Uncharacterized protein n=1 Tax=Candidatus Yanofskybacteria bacterium RIFCSPLOWO2_01_FULL_49_17 TaxID=1802700 RepID=A0A1F8GQQ0_9BACT|nr:MAG: hypothetical protein A2941_02665 [Candidatus Yanofskybacteria bacterium RIFCSPLOWO2_01_FULL_49_17]